MDDSRDKEVSQLVRELEFRTTVTTAMLSTLDPDQVLYVILSGITSGDGLGFNRAFLFLLDEAGRFLRVNMALGPPSGPEGVRRAGDVRRRRLTLNGLLKRFQDYRSADGAELTQRMGSFALPMERLESMALSPQALARRQR